MPTIEKQLNTSFAKLTRIYSDLSNGDKAQFLVDACNVFKTKLNLEVSSDLLFEGIEQLVIAGVKDRWKPCYLVITINSYQNKDIKRVYKRLQTFAKKKKFEIVELDMGEDWPDTYFEIQTHSKNKWEEHKLVFNSYIPEKELFDFLEQFPEIKIGPKER